MADNTIGWGQGSVNNTNDWGKGKANSTNDWGSIYANSPSGETNIEGGSAVNPDAFIIQVKTDNAGTSNNDQFTLPMTVGTYDVDWGDGNVDTSVSGTQTHTYTSAGIYDISVTGGTKIQFNSGGDKDKLLDIKQWGTNVWSSFNSAYFGCSNMIITATDIPNLTSVSSYTSAFRYCSSLTTIGTNASSWLVDASDCRFIFENCTNFNDNINNWDFSGISDMRNMFRGCSSFNQPLDNWDVSSATVLQSMFQNASSFNQDLSSWDINQVQYLSNFMSGVTLSTANYDALLIGWDSQGAMSYSGTVNFGSSQYTSGGAAEAARTSLIAKWGGIIDGGGV